MEYSGVERRSRPKLAMLAGTVLAVSMLALGPIFLMAQTSLDRALVFFTCLPLSGLSYAWLWRERRQRILRWATVAFAGAVCIWVAFFFSFIFERKDELQGMVLVSTSIIINLLLFWFLNLARKRKRLSAAALPDEPVI